MTDIEAPKKQKRGFALLSPEQRKARASKGGKNAHAKGTAHEFKRGEEAAAAGRKGGAAYKAKLQKIKETP